MNDSPTSPQNTLAPCPWHLTSSRPPTEKDDVVLVTHGDGMDVSMKFWRKALDWKYWMPIPPVAPCPIKDEGKEIDLECPCPYCKRTREVRKPEPSPATTGLQRKITVLDACNDIFTGLRAVAGILRKEKAAKANVKGEWNKGYSCAMQDAVQAIESFMEEADGRPFTSPATTGKAPMELDTNHHGKSAQEALADIAQLLKETTP